MEEFNELLSGVSTAINFIISVILLIVFFVMAYNISKIKKLQMQYLLMVTSMAKVQGVTNERKCGNCGQITEIPKADSRTRVPCSYCSEVHQNLDSFYTEKKES